MQNFHATDGFVHAEHFHKSVAFGAVSAAVVNDFHVANTANAFEKLLEVLLGDVVGQVSDVNAGGLDAFGITTAAALAATVAAATAFLGWATIAFLAFFARLTWSTRLAWGTRFVFIGTGVAGVGLGRARGWKRRGRLRMTTLAGWRSRLLIKADSAEDFLPKAQFRRSVFTRGARSLRTEFLGTVAVLVATTIATVAAIVVLILIAVGASA